MDSVEAKELANLWLKWDKNPTTRDEISSLVSQGNTAELAKRMTPRIEFGTAGLRARMEAGFSRLNDLTITQTTQGLVNYLLKSVSSDPTKLSVVVGHDHRHNSSRFARLTAAVFLIKGIKVYFFNKIVHTPMVPFTITHKKATCGIMITASHNPKDDNGYKLYWSNGSQIIPPLDNLIANSVLENLEPVYWDEAIVEREAGKLCIDPFEEAEKAYIEMMNKLTTQVMISDPKKSAVVKFAYTAMHGVGARPAAIAFKVFGFPSFVPVTQQIEPHPDFPTVKFPNPEESGALVIL